MALSQEKKMEYIHAKISQVPYIHSKLKDIIDALECKPLGTCSNSINNYYDYNLRLLPEQVINDLYQTIFNYIAELNA